MSPHEQTSGSRMVDQPPSPILRRRKGVGNATTICLDASQRLVEYFVVISSVPQWETKSSKQKNKPRHNSKKRSRLSRLPSLLRKNSKYEDDQEVELVVDPPDVPPTTKESGTTAFASVEDDGNIRMPQSAPEHTFSPKITSRYPLSDHKDHAFNPMMVPFCVPHSDVIAPSQNYILPRIHHFVLTNDRGRKVYGTCLTFYEEFHLSQSDPLHQDTIHENHSSNCQPQGSQLNDGIEVSVARKGSIVYVPKVLCLLSTWPYLTAFREYLTQLYRLVTSRHYMESMNVPLERYITNICCEIPAPPPGAFEVQVPILDSTIRFWAPPAKLPVAYVALEYQMLFDCLDVKTLLRVWHCLVCERKVLFLSSQYSLLTTCAELFCSLLFPMQWSHLYIPLVPRFLAPILDAPMPYLCGVVRDNWLHAQNHVSNETIVVDLDNNTVTFGVATPPLPQVPPKRYLKLTGALESAVGELYWKTRGVEKEYSRYMQNRMSLVEFEQSCQKGNARWKLKLQESDEALSQQNFAYTPDCPTMLNSRDIGERKRWDRVQESFLRFYVSVLKDYRRYLVTNSNVETTAEGGSPHATDKRWCSNRYFDSTKYIAAQKVEYAEFLKEFCFTQQFDTFMTKRLYSPGEADVVFFDQSIDAKLNRSKLMVKKLETPFLRSAKAHKVLNTITAVAPSNDGLLLSQAEEKGIYSDGKWPETLDPSKFGTPRPIPTMITTEFDRQSALVERLREIRDADKNMLDDESQIDFPAPSDDMYSDSNPEAATFTLFFTMFATMIGRDWQKKCQSRNHCNRAGDDCILSNSSMNSESSNIGSSDNIAHNDKMEEARAVAAAQLDLAFDVLDMMKMRGLMLHPDAAKCLTEACGRCGDTERASQLMKILSADGLVASSEMHSHLMMAFVNGEQDSGIKHTPGTSNAVDSFSATSPHETYSTDVNKKIVVSDMDNNIQEKHSGNSETTCPVFLSDDENSVHSEAALSMGSQNSSVSGSSDSQGVPMGEFEVCPKPGENWLFDEVYSMINYYWYGTSAEQRKAKKMRKKLRKRQKKSLIAAKQAGRDQFVTVGVEKQTTMSDSLMNFLYPNMSINMSSDSCLHCSRTLSESDIVLGWQPHQFQDFTTGCPDCHHRFVPGFSVECTAPTFEGSQGIATPLYCEFLSPWVLMNEVRHVLRKDENGIEEMLDPQWRSGTSMHATLWWNMVILFMRYQLPVSFLLQGSFQNPVIDPEPV